MSRQNNFKFDAQQAFLTYPQCDVSLEEILRQLKEKYGGKYGWCVLSAEDHEERENDSNVGVHRHAIVYACSRFTTRDQRFWDVKYQDKVFHPHVEKVKNKVQCMQYVIKDGQYIQDGQEKDAPFSVDIYLQSTKTKTGYGFTYLATKVKEGKTLDDIDEEVPGMVMNHKRKIEDYIMFSQQKKERLTPKPKFPGFEVPRVYDWELIVEWANKNFMQKREPRQPQLWIWSREPEMGKSFPWAITMRKYFNCYEWIYGQKQGKAIMDCEYILLDELKGGITVTELKSLSQMYGMNLDLKFGDITFFGKNVPLIVTSNRPPREIYHKCSQEDIQSLESRFLIVNVDEVCHIKVKKEVEILVPATPSPPMPEPDPVQERLALLGPSPLTHEDTVARVYQASPHLQRYIEAMDEKDDVVDMSDSEDERDYDDHSELSNEEFDKMCKLRNSK